MEKKIIEKEIFNHIKSVNKDIDFDSISFTIDVNPGIIGFTGMYISNGKRYNLEFPNNEIIELLVYNLYEEVTKYKKDRWNFVNFNYEKSELNISYLWDKIEQVKINKKNNIKWDGYNMKLEIYDFI